MKINIEKFRKNLKDRAKAVIAKSTTKTLEKGARKGAGEIGKESTLEVDEHYSITKYLRGGIFGAWDGSEAEQRLYKALGQDSGTAGGFFVPPVLSTEVIELLKDKAVIRSMPGVRVIPVSGTDKVKFNAVTDAPTISWGSENTAISEDTTLAFGQDTLETHKAVCLYKMSRELLTNANVNMDSLIRSELADALALEEDSVFLEGTGGTKPLGIYYNTRVVSTDLSGTIGVDNLKDAMYQVELLHSGVTGWVSHPRTVNDFAQLKDSVGRYIFGIGPGEATLSNLLGLPLRKTTQIAVTNRPSSNESYVVGGRWSDFIIGDGQGLRIETSTDADTAFAADQVWMKLVKFLGSYIRHPESFVVIKGIQAS